MAQLQVEMTGDEARLYKSLQKIIAQEKKMEDGFKGVKKESRDAGRQAQRSFGSQMIRRIGQVATGMFSVSTAIGLARDMMRFYAEETRKGVEQTRQLVEQRQRLAQISSGNLPELDRRADEAAARYGVDRSVARAVLFSAESEGFSRDYERILRANTVLDPQSAANIAGRGDRLFRGELTPMQAINATLQGSRRSRLDFAQIAQVIPQASEGGIEQGASTAETIAALSVLAGEFGSGQTAADRLKAFSLRASLDPRVAGQGFLGATRTLQEMSPSDRQEFLGTSQELNVAYSKLVANFDAIESEMQSVSDVIRRTGTDQSLLNQRIRESTDPTTDVGRGTNAFIESERARIQREISTEAMMAESGFGRQAAIDTFVARERDRGRSEFDIHAGEGFGRLASALGLSPGGVETATGLGRDFGGPADTLVVGLINALEANTEAQRNTGDSTQLNALRQNHPELFHNPLSGHALVAPDMDR